jgi:hypothetical protein
MHRLRAEGWGWGWRAGVAVIAALLATCALAGPAAAGGAPIRFKPRIAGAMGIEPAHGSGAAATGPAIPAAYHGGSVMRDFTIHTVFWAPSGFQFDGSPGPGVPGYAALVQQFFAGVAHDSGAASNFFSLLDQYGDHAGAGSYRIHYDPAADTVIDSDPYPAQSRQCISPAGIATCVTDLQVQQEVDRVIGAHDTPARGLTNVWFILLPPDVDECISLGACGTTQFAGYHSAFDLGHGSTVYSVVPDPLIELTPPPGSDPEGNPEAESAIDTLGHEAMEAATNPLGNAWMDPNGFEVADKCEDGGEQGTPLGFAADGSPYNQLIDGHPYLIQDIWSNSRGGCVQSSTTVASVPALHTIDLRQFSPMVSGSIGAARRVPVVVELARGATLVALALTETRADGGWGPVMLRGRDGGPYAVGDDRDQLAVAYGSAATSPSPDFIQTGDGGNPFTQSGFTGWFDLDHGYAVQSRGGNGTVTVGPCSQTGELSLRVDAVLSESPVDLCSTETDTAAVPVGAIGARTALTLTSQDNRGEYLRNPGGTLVKLTVSLGEPGSVSALRNPQVPFTPTGFPTCTAFLRIRSVRCAGLVPGDRYALTRGGETIGRGPAGKAGAAVIDGVSMRGGDVLTLQNTAGRRLTSLHVAHLRVDIIGNETDIASGTCQPGDYWGRLVTAPPTGGQIGIGIAGTGTICPASGRAHGLPTAEIAQTDDFSGGQTETQVPGVRSTSPLQDETLYGSFVASAQSGLPGPHGSVSATGVPVALTISGAASRRRVFHAGNVDTATGVSVSGLSPGAYVASWVLHDAAGDTRTLTTRFVDEP